MTRTYKNIVAVLAVVTVFTLGYLVRMYVVSLPGSDVEENLSTSHAVDPGREKTVKSRRTRRAAFPDIETSTWDHVAEAAGPNRVADAVKTKDESAEAIAERCKDLAEELLSAMRGKDGDRMMESLGGLVSKGDAAVPELERLLRQGLGADVKETAALGLAQIGTPKAVSVLLAGIRQTTELDLQHNLVDALNEIQGTESADALLETLLEEDESILRDGVRDTIARIADSQVIRTIVATYEEKVEHGWQKGNLLATILRVRSESAVPALSEILITNSSISLRTKVAMSLGAIGNKDAIYVLASAISDSKSAGMAPTYAQAMASIKNKEAEPLLQKYLTESPNENLRRGAALALGNIPWKSVADTLDSALAREESEQVRQAIEYSRQKIFKEIEGSGRP